MTLLIEHPLIAVLPAGLFALQAWRTGQRLAWWAAANWAGYALYELGMQARLLCSGECNIRIDLFLIYPELVLLSAVTLVLGWRARRAGRIHEPA